MLRADLEGGWADVSTNQLTNRGGRSMAVLPLLRILSLPGFWLYYFGLGRLADRG